MTAKDDKFAKLFKVGKADASKLYEPASLSLLAELKVTDMPRYMTLRETLMANGVTQLTELGRVVDRRIRQAKEEQKTKQQEANAKSDCGFVRDGKGNIKPTRANVIRALDQINVKLKYDAFHGEPVIEGLADCGPSLDDVAMNRLWVTVGEECDFRITPASFETFVIDECHRNRFHPVLDYIDSLKWDGKPRLDTWLTDYLSAADTPFNRAVGRHVLVAAVRRVLHPGTKFDCLTVLESEEGEGKSSLIEALAIKPQWFSDSVQLNVDDRRMIESTSGKFIIEISELSGMRKGEVEKIKAQLSRSADRARLAYGRLPVEIARQFIAFATTNSNHYLASQTGNRRFWPVRVGTIRLAEFIEVVDQLWAEASVAEATDESIVLDRSLWADAVAAQKDRELHNLYTDKLALLLGDKEGFFLVEDLWEPLGISFHTKARVNREELNKALTGLGFTPCRRTVNKRKLNAYERKPADGSPSKPIRLFVRSSFDYVTEEEWDEVLS